MDWRVLLQYPAVVTGLLLVVLLVKFVSGAGAVLVGETLMRSPDPGVTIRSLRGAS